MITALARSGTDGYAGGIENGANLTVAGSAISGNTGNAAGAILNRRALTMTNSTVSGNTGGGIMSTDSGSSLSLTNCTLTENSSFGVTSFPATVGNNIIARNGNGGNGPDVIGNFNSQGHNLIGNGDGGGVSGGATGFNAPGDQVGTSAAPINPLLGTLADNGGPTLTHALLAGSPALDAGNNAVARDASNNPLLTDQRGAGRIADSTGNGMNAAVDIGAFEYHQFIEPISDKATNEDTPLSFLFNIGDVIGRSVSIDASSDNPALVPDANLTVSGSVPLRTLQIVPAANGFGTAHITLTATYSDGAVRDSVFLLTVMPVNDAPTFTVGPDQIVSEDSGAQTVTNWATDLSSGPNESGQLLSFLVSGNTNAGLFSNLPSISPSGALTYTLAPNANGSAVITISLRDDGGTANGGRDISDAQTFMITVTPVNDAPVAFNDSYAANEDIPLSVFAPGVLGNDTDLDTDPLVAALVSVPNNGSVTLNANGSFTYTPNANFNGADSFTYRVSDGNANSSPATVTLTVNPVNDAPVNNVPGAQSTIENHSINFSAANGNLLSVADADVSTGFISLILTATNGAISLASTVGLTFTAGDGTADATMTLTGRLASVNAALNGLSFIPTDGFSGTAILQIITNDQGNTGSGGALADSDAVSILVLDAGAFQFNTATYSVNENAGNITITVTRTGGIAGAASVNYATSNGTATAGADYATVSGTLTFAPGETTKTFSIPIIEDAAVEGSEFLSLQLINPTGGAVLGNPATASLTILDNDTCAYSLSPASKTSPAAGETTTVNVTAQAGCTWTAVSNSNFISVTSGASGSGNGAVTLSVASNGSGVPRTGTVTIAGQTFTITQPELAPEIPTIQFGAASYAVGEGEGRVMVTVTLTGGSVGGVSVNYRTMDTDTFTVGCAANNNGGAFARCDFATTVGRLDFAPGETQKTITVPIINDGHDEGAETFQIVLSNPAGVAVLGATSTTGVAIQDDDAAGAPNPVTTAQPFFVRQQYLDFLSREPDEVGFNAWLNVLSRCADVNTGPNVPSQCDRIFVSGEGFFRSQEFQLKGFYVFRFYQLAFNRLPEYTEIVSDMSFVAGATEAEVYARKAQLAGSFTGRQEFQTAYGGMTNEQYVSALLGRYGLTQITTPDPANPDGTVNVTLTNADLTNRLNANTLTRAQALRAVADSVEVGAREFNNAFVGMQYYGYLRRKPDGDGFQAWLSVLRAGDVRTMVNGFLNSTEYKLRFGSAQ